MSGQGRSESQTNHTFTRLSHQKIKVIEDKLKNNIAVHSEKILSGVDCFSRLLYFLLCLKAVSTSG